jgi:hypothetical protein
VTEGAYLELLAGFLEEYLELLLLGFFFIKFKNDRAALAYLELPPPELAGFFPPKNDIGGSCGALGAYLERLFLGGG